VTLSRPKTPKVVAATAPSAATVVVILSKAAALLPKAAVLLPKVAAPRLKAAVTAKANEKSRAVVPSRSAVFYVHAQPTHNHSPLKINMTKSKKKNVKVHDLKTKKDVKGGGKRRRRSHSGSVSDITDDSDRAYIPFTPKT
jgi:hypothetical protein